MKRQIVESLLRAREAKLAIALLTDLRDGTQRLFEPDAPDASISEELRQVCVQVLQSDRSRAVTVINSAIDQGADSQGTGNSDSQGAGVREIFVQAFNPPLRMVVIGAVHITQTLVPMAKAAGYQVIVIDPRISFATAQRFPGVELHTDWPDEVMPSMQLDARTAVVTLTHDPKIDDPALHAALRSPAFYIGCLGSKRTHAGRLERLLAAGFNEDDLARIYGPLGLALGARSPAEIALSALAQITARLRGSTLA